MLSFDRVDEFHPKNAQVGLLTSIGILEVRRGGS